KSLSSVDCVIFVYHYLSWLYYLGVLYPRIALYSIVLKRRALRDLGGANRGRVFVTVQPAARELLDCREGWRPRRVGFSSQQVQANRQAAASSGRAFSARARHWQTSRR